MSKIHSTFEDINDSSATSNTESSSPSTFIRSQQNETQVSHTTWGLWERRKYSCSQLSLRTCTAYWRQGQEAYEACMIVRSARKQEIEKKKTKNYDAENRAEKAEEAEVAEAVTNRLHQFEIDEKWRERRE